MALIATFLFGFPAIIFIDKGQWLEAVICIVVIVFAWGLYASAVEDAKAYVNRRNYWAMSGRDRVIARRRWEADADADMERRLLRSIPMKEKERLRNTVATFTCRECGKTVQTYGFYSTVNGRVIRRYDCPA